MDWQNVLKRKIETLADYTNASPDERRLYHSQKRDFYNARLKALRNSIANVGETNPNIPLEEDMKELQDIRNFHGRQFDRIKLGLSIPDVFSPELEQQRLKRRLVTTPRGEPNPYPDLSMEEYERLNNKQKLKYHASKARRTLGEEKKFHLRMGSRIKGGSVLTTFPTSDLGGETTLVRGINYTKEEYDNMSREDKQKYHTMMRERFKKTDIERSKFHNIMSARLRRNSPLPTFFSPEHEEEE